MQRRILTYDISTLTPYISWTYFYHGWQTTDPQEQERLKAEALGRLKAYEGRYHAYAVYALGDANSDVDDIIFEGYRLPMLRQQASDRYLCLADFVRPVASGEADRLCLFATSVDAEMEQQGEDDVYESLMNKLLADRLAEAAAECLHEHLMGAQGIRPAVGYPSMPDMSMNFLLSDILGSADIGIQLTENGAMRPHSSVSGMIMPPHPAATYFNIGRIGDDQLHDYARRRGMDEKQMRRFLAGNL